MSNLAITCANCGAKYRLPETFAKDHAKCTKCGSVIDVKSQRGAASGGAAAPAAAKPAKAQPAKARGAEGSASPAKARPARARRSESEDNGEGRSSRGGSSRSSRSGSSGRRSRRGEAQEAEAGGNKGMLYAGIGVAALAIVGGIWFLTSEDGEENNGGKDQKQVAEATKDGDAKNEPAKANKPAEAPEKDDAADPKNDEPKAAEAGASKDDAKPAEADARKDKPEEDDTPKQVPANGNENWMRSKAESIADVFVPKDELEPVAWPDAVPESERERINGLLDDVDFGGTKGVRAKTELAEIGHPALFGIINRLREIDYTDEFGLMYGYELNKLLETMLVGMNAGYIPTQVGLDMSTIQNIKTADWNAMTARAWQGVLHKQAATPEDFEKLVTARKNRNVNK